MLKTEGPVHDRSVSYAQWLWAAVGPLIIIISLETWIIHPELPLHGVQNVSSWLGIVVVLVSAWAIISGLRSRKEMRAFIGSNFLIVGLLATDTPTRLLYGTLLALDGRLNERIRLERNFRSDSRSVSCKAF